MNIVEIAIWIKDMGPGFAQIGDIVVARKPLMYVGTAELKTFFWLWVSTDDIGEILLTEPMAQEKRRFFVDMPALGRREPKLDLRRLTDPYANYQALLKIDRYGRRQGVMDAIPASEIVVDKITKRLLRG